MLTNKNVSLHLDWFWDGDVLNVSFYYFQLSCIYKPIEMYTNELFSNYKTSDRIVLNLKKSIYKINFTISNPVLSV